MKKKASNKNETVELQNNIGKGSNQSDEENLLDKSMNLLEENINMSQEDVQNAKFDLLGKFRDLQLKGMILPKLFNMSSDYNEMVYEYEILLYKMRKMQQDELRKNRADSLDKKEEEIMNRISFVAHECFKILPHIFDIDKICDRINKYNKEKECKESQKEPKEDGDRDGKNDEENREGEDDPEQEPEKDGEYKEDREEDESQQEQEPEKDGEDEEDKGDKGDKEDKVDKEDEGDKEDEEDEGEDEDKEDKEDKKKIKEIVISCNKNLDCIDNVVNLDDNICLVDLSYMVFTRFFAVRKWYEIKNSRDKPERKIPNDYNWLEDNEFMAKYYKLFYEKLFNFCYKNKIPRYNIIFIMDCRHDNNWRVKLQNDYKGTRKDSHEKNRFFSYGIFDYVRNKLIPELQEESRNIVLRTHDLEADDIIACLVKYFKSRKYDKKMSIITSDKDYFQLCDNKNICCYDLSGKNISYNTLKDFNNNALQYLIFKILLGDPSDNIPSCYISKEFLKMADVKTNKAYLKCSKIVINKFLNVGCCKKLLIEYVEYVRDKKTLDKVLLENKWFDKLDIFESITKDKQFESNATLIDFENIPLKHRNNVNELFDKIFKN